MENADRLSLLRFVTGLGGLPSNGTLERWIEVRKVLRRGYAPMAHTCYHQLDLPDFESEEEMREKLMLAIHQPMSFGQV